MAGDGASLTDADPVTGDSGMTDAPPPVIACADMNLGSALGASVASGSTSGAGNDYTACSGDGPELTFGWFAPATGMFRIEVSVDPVDLPLKSGLVAKQTILPSSAKAGALVYVPIAAIVEGNGRTARVFVLDKDHARRRDVEVAFIEGESVALNGGLEAGEQVITYGAQYLEDGEQVTTAVPLAARREF